MSVTLKVVYSNPNPQGGNIYYIKDVTDWVTKNRELHICTVNGSGTRPDIIFASGSWVCAEVETVDQKVGKVEPAKATVRRPVTAVLPTPTPAAPIQLARNGRRQSTLSDLSYPTPEAVEQAHAASVEFAIGNQVIPWSAAHMQALLDYERSVEAEFGPDSIDKLPWNRIPRADG